MTKAMSCPVCGNIPMLKEESMETRPGHGYPGNYSYTCKCCCCDYIKYGSSCDLGQSKQEAINKAIEEWNENVLKFLETYKLGHEGDK